jgi:hypothetical protein
MVNDTDRRHRFPSARLLGNSILLRATFRKLFSYRAAMPRRVPAVGASPRTAQLESTVAARAGALAVADTVAIS